MDPSTLSASKVEVVDPVTYSDKIYDAVRNLMMKGRE